MCLLRIPEDLAKAHGFENTASLLFSNYHSMNAEQTPGVEAVLKAKEIAIRADALSADRGQLFTLEDTLEHFATEIQSLADHFPENRWLGEKAQRLPLAIASGKVSWAIFDELKLGCEEIVSRFRHVIQSNPDETTTREFQAA